MKTMQRVGMTVKAWVCAVFVSTAVALSVFADDPKPRVLSEKEAETFSTVVVNRETKKQNYIALERLVAEKQALFKTVASSLASNHQVKPNESYTYVAADKTLYLLSTNGVAKGKEPKKTVVTKFKTDEESLPLRKLMATRLQIETQLGVLAALAEENKQEALGWDAHLRKTFDLKPAVQYEIKKRDDGAFEISELPEKK